MASKMNTRVFFAEATTEQFDFVSTLYDKALRLKAESKSSKPENVIKLDKWYQNELPKKIKSRGKDAHLVHDELVQTIKWKLQRGKFRPNLVNLVQMNTPRVVMQDTKKAFRNLQKKNDLQAAANVLCNIKGVGPAMASAVLAAGAPHMAPFMADECLLAMPDVEGLDYTMREYMRFVDYVKACVERLNSQGGTTWTPHTVELAVWTHSICYDLSPELLEDMPEANAKPAGAVNPAAAAASSEAEVEEDKPSNNGQIAANDEDTKSSMASSTMDEDSQQGSNTKTEEETTSEIPPPASEVQPPSEAPEAVAKEEPVAEVQPLSTSEKEEKSTTNGNTPKTNGNNSHNGSEVPKNGEEAEAKDNNSKAEDQPKNGELENGVKSNEESTDLSSQDKNHSTGEKRNSEAVTEEVEPAAKKLKTCEDQAPSEESSESPVPPKAEDTNSTTQSATPAANPAPQVAV